MDLSYTIKTLSITHGLHYLLNMSNRYYLTNIKTKLTHQLGVKNIKYIIQYSGRFFEKGRGH